MSSRTDLAEDTEGVAHTRAVLRRLELEVSRRLDGILQGDHRGLVPGHGSEPGEARPYQAGDDVRRIDWNVSARTNTIHLRETIAERELETWLLVDRSASLSFGTALRTKAELVLAAAAGVGVLTARGGNRLGAMIMTGDRIVTTPARQGRAHMLAILDRVRAVGTQDGRCDISLGAALQRLGAVSKRRGLVVVLSDFLDEPESWRHPLAALAIRHQVMCIEVIDPRELELPDSGTLTLIDTESGRVREVNTGSRRLRERYSAEAEAQRRAIAAAIRGAGGEHLQLRTDSDWLLDMARFVVTRRRRMANTAAGSRRP